MASKDTGMALDAEVEIAVSKFRARKSSFVIFKINAEGDRFVVDSKGKRRDTVATFLSKLPENDMRLCIMNHEYNLSEEQRLNKNTSILKIYSYQSESHIKTRVVRNHYYTNCCNMMDHHDVVVVCSDFKETKMSQGH